MASTTLFTIGPFPLPLVEKLSSATTGSVFMSTRVLSAVAIAISAICIALGSITTAQSANAIRPVCSSGGGNKLLLAVESARIWTAESFKMTRLLRSAWIWAATGALILLWVPLLGAIRLFDVEPRRLRTGRWFRRLGRVLARVNPWRIHISGGENLNTNQVYVIVSNHQSMADIPVISHLKLDTKWLAKAELFRLPLLGWMLRMTGDVPIERSDRRKGATAMLQCARYLRQRCSVVFFPEGTRSPDGRVLPFNEGPFKLAIREQIPILPLVVEGSGTALPRNSWIFGRTQDIHLRILDAIPVDGWNIKQVSALRDAVRQRIVDELDRLRGTGRGS